MTSSTVMRARGVGSPKPRVQPAGWPIARPSPAPGTEGTALNQATVRSITSPSLLFTAKGEPVGLHDFYRGRSCFLICGGPSFGKLDHAKLRQPGILTMGVNNSVKTFRPHLWACADNPDHFLRSIWLDPTIIKFAQMKHAEALVFDSDQWKYTTTKAAECPATFFYQCNSQFDAARFLTESTISWGNDNRHGGARSVMLVAIRLLHYLGVRRIFLLGCDFKMASDYCYHFSQGRTRDAVSMNNYVYRTLEGRFRQLRPIFEQASLQIYNCNPESDLKVFRTIEFDRAITQCREEFGNIDVVGERTSGLYDLRKPSMPKQGAGASVKEMAAPPSTFKPGLTVITCTRNRPEAFKLLERWMGRQTRKWDQWIVVNDGQERYRYTLGQEVITRTPVKGEGHSLAANLLAALPRVRHEHIVFVEDDDWLGPKYLESMTHALQKAPLAGNTPARYYHVAKKRWQDMQNRGHASLGQTAIHFRLLPVVAEIARSGSPQIDLALWQTWSGKKCLIQSKDLHVGIRGMPGISEAGVGHRVTFGKRDVKPDNGTLRDWIGEDASAYTRSQTPRFASTATPKVGCVITCHNYGRYLRQCIDSCLQQRVRFLKILVVDDASSDDTKLIAESYKRTGVQYMRGDWNNVCVARNAGAKAMGRRIEYLFFMDADDWMEPDYVMRLLDAAVKGPRSCGVTYGSLRCFDDVTHRQHALKLVRPFSLYEVQKRNLAGTPSLIHRCAFDQVGGWCEAISKRTDWNLWLRLVRRGWTMQYVPEAVLHYRKHPNSTTSLDGDSRIAGVMGIRHGMLICIVTPFCGRKWALPIYERTLNRIEWERTNLFVVAINNSGSPHFGKALQKMLERTRLAHTVIQSNRKACDTLSSEALADSAGARVRNFAAMNEQMCMLYSCAKEMLPTSAGMVWTLEDDIEVPEHTLTSLTGTLYAQHDVGVAVGCAKSRFRRKWMLWKDGLPVECPQHTVEVDIDRSGFYCSLFRREIWDGVAFMPDASTEMVQTSYDWSAYDHIRKSGTRIVAHGDVVCKHWQADGTWI